MGTLDGRDDTLHACQLVATVDSLIVVDAQHLGTTLFRHVAVHGSYTWVVKACRDGEGLLYLPVLVLHNQHFGTMQNTRSTTVDGCCGVVSVPAVTASLGQHNLHAVIVHIVIDGTGSIASAADAGHKVVRVVAPYLFFKLPLDFL